MKKILNIIHRPKIFIPSIILVAIAILVGFYNYVGQKPVVVLPTDTSMQTYSSNGSYADSVDLAFPKVGRVAAVSVKVGDTVKKGDVIASLDANDALGAINQAKGALELARAQYASLDVQYMNAKNQQDTLVANARRTLLSSGLVAIANNTDKNNTYAIDNNQVPIITGTYSCDKEGPYEINPYSSAGTDSGYSFS